MFSGQGQRLGYFAIFPHIATVNQEPDREIQASGSPIYKLSYRSGLERGIDVTKRRPK